MYKQLLYSSYLVGKTIKTITEDSSEMYILFEDKTFIIFRARTNRDGYTEFYVDRIELDLIPKKLGDLDYLLDIGFISDQDEYDEHKKRIIESNQSESEQQAELFKQQEINKLKELRLKYPNV
jgi:hypothetical protein